MKHILFLVASLRAESLNRRLSLVAGRMLPEGYEAMRFDLSEARSTTGIVNEIRSPRAW